MSVDQVLIDSYTVIARRCGYSIEKIERIPELHTEYVNMVRLHCDWDDQKIFARVTNLRRKGKLPRSRELARST